MYKSTVSKFWAQPAVKRIISGQDWRAKIQTFRGAQPVLAWFRFKNKGWNYKKIGTFFYLGLIQS